jgi:hypothetical protein
MVPWNWRGTVHTNAYRDNMVRSQAQALPAAYCAPVALCQACHHPSRPVVTQPWPSAPSTGNGHEMETLLGPPSTLVLGLLAALALLEAAHFNACWLQQGRAST